MGYRLNERNTGDWSLDSTPKAKKVTNKLTAPEKETIQAILTKVYDAMEWDESVDGLTDGGRFTLCLSQPQMDILSKSLKKNAL